MKYVFFTAIAFLIHIDCKCQQKKTHDIYLNDKMLREEGTLSFFFRKEIYKSINLLNDSNFCLTHIYSATDSNLNITNIIYNSLIQKNLQAYRNIHNAKTVLTTEAVNELFNAISKKADTSSKINYIPYLYITEEWSINKTTLKLERLISAVSFGWQKAITSKPNPIFWVKGADFMNIIKPYWVILDGTTVLMTKYIKEGFYKSRVTGDSLLEVYH